MTPAQQIALWADRLRDMSAMGLRFSPNVYDRENYLALRQMAIEMLALASAQPLAEIEPLRATHFARPTPLTAGDAAVIDRAGKILLIRRADNGLWAMPGGAMAVGETPAEAVVRETYEETGVHCEPVALAGVHDSRLCGTRLPFHLYHFLFLCKPADGAPADHPPTHAHEVLEAGWFAQDALPPHVDPGHAGRIPEAFRVWRGDCCAYFDRF